MTDVYRIREWETRYEVNFKNRAWKPGEAKRAGSLSYIRMPSHGHGQSRGFRRLNKLAADLAPAAFAVFTKLLEIAADNAAGRRGYILETDGKPMTASDIADCLDWDSGLIEKSLNILCDKSLAWVEVVDFREFPESPGNFPSESESESESETETETETESAATATARARAGAAAAEFPSFDSQGRKPGVKPAAGELAAGEPAAIIPAAEVIRAWNVVAVKRGWPQCSKVPGGRAGVAFRAALADPYFAENYRTALDRMAAITWNKHPLRIATLVKPDTVRAIVDGEWDNPTGLQNGIHTGGQDLGF